MQTHSQPYPDTPLLLVIAGHDPTGGAGIQADIESAAALGVHAATLISCLTLQDTCNVERLEPISTQLLQQQLDLLCADLHFDACKLGLLGSAQHAELLADYLAHRRLPTTVLDPILAAGGGTQLASDALLSALRLRLIPQIALMTPNLPEAQRLSGQQSPDDCANALIQGGCPYVLISGGHGEEDDIINRLYSDQGQIGEWAWPRLPFSFHGSGCTLSSAIAALLAKGVEMETAVAQAQPFVWHSLSRAYTLGRGQRIPNRLNH